MGIDLLIIEPIIWLFFGLVSMVIAHQFHLFAGLRQHRIIDDENAIIQRAGVGDSQDTVDEKSDKLAPVEPIMVQKPVNGVLLSIEKSTTILVYPQSPDALLEERQQHEDEQHADGSIALFLPDAGLVQKGSKSQ